ncbi:MAG: hypothetical protein NVS2B7_07450 [Herpetosiphon sp.]
MVIDGDGEYFLGLFLTYNILIELFTDAHRCGNASNRQHWRCYFGGSLFGDNLRTQGNALVTDEYATGACY